MRTNNKNQLSFSTPLLLAFLWTTDARISSSESKDKMINNIAIEGMVYCRSCNLKELNPMSNTTVKLKCINFSDYYNFQKLTKTDDKGYFFLKIDGFKANHPLWEDPRFACHVTLASSSLHTFETTPATVDSLRYENMLYGRDYDARIYSTGPITFQPGGCPLVP